MNQSHNGAAASISACHRWPLRCWCSIILVGSLVPHLLIVWLLVWIIILPLATILVIVCLWFLYEVVSLVFTHILHELTLILPIAVIASLVVIIILHISLSLLLFFHHSFKLFLSYFLCLPFAFSISILQSSSFIFHSFSWLLLSSTYLIFHFFLLILLHSISLLLFPFLFGVHFLSFFSNSISFLLFFSFQFCLLF